MDKSEKAAELFMSGYNCSQAVCAAFAEDFGFPLDEVIRLSKGLGGGVGRLRETCGAVSGMAMVLSMKFADSEPGNTANKTMLYSRIQQAADMFREQHGSLNCGELIKMKRTTPIPDERTAEYYKKRPCVLLIQSAARILAGMLGEDNK